MLFFRTTCASGTRLTRAGRRTAGFLATATAVATLAVAPTPASAATSTDPALVGLFGNTDPTYDAVYRQSLSIIALDTAGAAVPDSAVAWLKRQRCANGSYTSFRPDLTTACGIKDSNATALASIAFKRIGRPKLAQQSVDWLIKQQTPTGGWEYSTGWGPDSNSTGLVVQALIAAKVDPATVTRNGNSPLDFLASVQLNCDSFDVADRGALDYQAETPLVANGFATSQATAALAGSSLPVKPNTSSIEWPTFTCDDTPQPTPAEAAAGYLGRTMDANGGSIRYDADNSVDYGSTANAVMSLVAAGYAANQVTQGVSVLENGAVDYTHDSKGKLLSASSAALALVAFAVDGNPRSFGSVNPIRQILRSQITQG